MHRLLIAIFFITLCFSASYAQIEQPDTTNTENTGVVVRSQKDSVPPPDTLIYSWKYAENNFIKLYADFDTTLMAVQLPEEYRREWTGYTYLGNLGTAVQNTSFYQRRSIDVNWQIKNFYPYLRTHSKTVFYNTKAPFTQLHYGVADKDWEYFTFKHTQNPNKNINAGIAYEIFNSEGYMIYQNTRNRNFGFWTDLEYDRYRLYSSINFNSINVLENGGIRSDFLLFDTTVNLQEINTKLSEAQNLYTYFNSAIDHQLKLFNLSKDSTKSRSIWLSHHFSFDKIRHLYTDFGSEYTVPETGEILTLYDNNYNGTNSNDTSAFLDYNNRLALTFQSGGNTKINFGPFVEYNHIKNKNQYRDTLFTYNNDTAYRKYAFGGQVTVKRKENFNIDIQGQYYPFEGYNKGNFKFSATLVKWQPLNFDTIYMHLRVFHEKRTPDYLLQEYYSNHLKWDITLAPVSERKAEFNIRLLKLRTNMKLTANHINNYIYFNKNMMVVQHKRPILVYGGELTQKVTFLKVMNFDATILGQYTESSIVDIPEFSAKGNLYFKRQFNFKNTGGKIDLYLGVSGSYYTNYFAPAYSPAIGQFYLQRKELIGNYPVVDAFLGTKIKNFLLFLRYEHINSGMRGSSYYSAYEYPLRPRNLRYGISWNFYN